MTQALNLANLANSVNSSGQLAGSAVNGAVASATNATNATNLTGGTCTIGTTQLGAGDASLMKNRIINGAMVIDQRNAGASVSSASTYTLDRWKDTVSATGKFTIQQNAGSVTPPVGFTNYLGITSSAATTVAAGDYYTLDQSIEGYNVADLGWGTASAKTITISFQVYSSLTGTFGCSLRNSAANRSYPFTYSIPVANTWTTISVTVAGDTTGTWVTNNGTGLRLFFGLGVGSTFSGTAGSWAGANYLGATGAVSVVGTNGATFYITGVQLEVGSSATGYEYRQYGQELALCQRYYELVSQFVGKATSAGQAEGSLTFLVQKRASPSLTVLNGTNTLLEIGVATRSFTTASGATQVNGGYVTFTGSASMTAPNMCVLYNSPSILGASAEL